MGQTPAFEVVSVKPLGPKDDSGLQGERFESARPLLELLIWVFDVKPYQLIRIPDWAPRVVSDASGLYRIDAVASHPVTDAEYKVMVQQLLKDKYKMIAHHEPRETPVYALVVAKNGPKIARADENPGIRVIVNGKPLGIAAGASKDWGLYKINLSFSGQGFSASQSSSRSRARGHDGITGAIGAQTGVRQGAYRDGRD
jgi:uncharacterized protein (TIGR03435 family)